MEALEALNRDLLTAAESVNLKAVEKSLENGAIVNCTDKDGSTPLHWAAQGGFLDVAELLISKGADIHSQDYLKSTPLHKAAIKGFLDVAELLISKGADINSQDDDGFTPLHWAARGGSRDVAELLISKGADIHSQDDGGFTPLHWAARGGSRDVAELLISKGADIHSQDDEKSTPLHEAAKGGSLDVAELLISKGADINSQDQWKSTPLHEAAKGGSLDVAELLISKGADINSQDQWKNTPLHRAAIKGSRDVAELLISKGADIHSQDWQKNTPLHWAASGGSRDVAELLISKGADIHSQDDNKNTPLHWAAQGGSRDVAELLISKGADINSQDQWKNTPLHRAAINGSRDVAELLISKGADIHSQDWQGFTPLHDAALGGFLDVAELLISKGADIHSQDDNKSTPLHWAAEGGSRDVAELLISKGADIHSQDVDKATPLHKAAYKGSRDVAELLISKGADIHSQDVRGQTAVDRAKGKTQIFLQLIESGVDVNQASEAANHCDSLMEAEQYIKTAVASLSSNIPPDVQQPDHGVPQPDHGVQQPDKGDQQPDQDIILPGITDAKELKSLLKLGTYKSFGNRIYLAGACSVGKSTLACLLIGDDIPKEWKSTDGLKIFFGRNGIHLEERKMVPLDKDKGNTNILSNVLRGQPGMDTSHPEKKQSQQEKSQPEERSSMSKLTNNDTSQQQPIPTGMESTQSEPPLSQSLMSDVSEKQATISEKVQANEKPIQKRLGISSIHEGIKQEIKKGDYKVKIAPSDLVDFGGQKSYDMTHQLFIQGKGTFNLLFDGRKGLHDPLPEYPQGNVTAALILKHWVDSILTYCGEDDDDILPVILFVATHRDTLTEDEQTKMMIQFQKDLKEMFQNHERANRIKYNDIYFINGTNRNDPEVIRLQTTYVDIAFRQKSWGERMPMAWVPLELQLSEMRAGHISIIAKDDLIKINEENDDLKLTDKQLDEFLRVQHVLGKIMYFKSQGLENFIIVQPTSLVDILRAFITDEMFFPADTTLRQILNKMTKTGKIRKEDLFKLWQQDEFNRHMPDDNFKEFVVQVLIHLDLLIEPKRYNTRGKAGDVYLVPCIIKEEITTNLCENLEENRTLYLSYKLLKSSIPSALSFKIIGSALNVWPLKKTDAGGVCLYNKAAILSIDQSNELYILAGDKRVVVCLQNKESRQFISPDIASCIQECLTLTIENAFKFYHSSFGKMASTLEITNLFNIEVGEKCNAEICYLPLPAANKVPSWKCRNGKVHGTKYPLYWTFDKVQVCKPDCTGLDQEAFKLCPDYKHLARLALSIGISKFRDFVIRIGLSTDDWEAFEYKHQGRNVNMMRIDALCAWKNGMDQPTFQDLHDAISGIGYNCHILCQIFREDRTIYDIDHPLLWTVPENDTLHELSKNIGTCAIRLGIELNVPDTEIEQTTTRYSKDIFQQNYDILLKWKNKYGKTSGTIRTLMHVLHAVDKRGCKFLGKQYKIKY